MSYKVVVIGESKNNELRNVSFESIAAAHKLSNEKLEIVGILLGEGEQQNEAQELIHYGADRVIVLSDEKLRNYIPEGYIQGIIPVLEEEKPDAIIMGHTAIGKDITPKIASRLDLGLISDVVDIELEDDQIVFTRPIYSGKAFEKKIITDGITFATVRPNNIASLTKDDSRKGEILQKDVDIKNLNMVIKDIVQKKTKGIDMSEASVIVAGGRGVGSEEGFEALYELADLLGGAVGASRGACDSGYCDYALQIGQTGKVVTPDLYIAIGVSGAIQHLAGMSSSKTIVAIDKDPDATIFNVADYGIVGDLHEVVPQLIKEIKAL